MSKSWYPLKPRRALYNIELGKVCFSFHSKFKSDFIVTYMSNWVTYAFLPTFNVLFTPYI